MEEAAQGATGAVGARSKVHCTEGTPPQGKLSNLNFINLALVIIGPEARVEFISV
jgi:hypothetical protein